ncbi:MAG: GTP cyclohydrolase I FolE [Rickettsiaceae bacterium]
MNISSSKKKSSTKPSIRDAKDAIRTLLEFIGEDPNRDGLLDTPQRVVESYKEIFAGYHQKAEDVLVSQFDNNEHIKEMVLLQSIKFTSFCEHHLLPIIGSVDVAYLPNSQIVGISKIARVVDLFAHRLQVQEHMTAQIAKAIDKHLKPNGVAVRVKASHCCMTIRGVSKESSMMYTSYYTGSFLDKNDLRNEFLTSIAK